MKSGQLIGREFNMHLNQGPRHEQQRKNNCVTMEMQVELDRPVYLDKVVIRKMSGQMLLPDDIQIERVFAIEREGTYYSTLYRQQFYWRDAAAKLNSLFQTLGISLDCEITIYHPFKDTFQPIDLELQVNPQLLEAQTVFVRYAILKDSSPALKKTEQVETDQKALRSKQRSILEVIQLVKKWREIHERSHEMGYNHRLNLQQAAKQVGVSKKSLDDYYYQLRLGEQFEFDFESHFNQKIGVLRTFVKKLRPEKEPTNKNARHPKILRMIKAEEIPRISVASTQQIQEVASVVQVTQNFTSEDSGNSWVHALIKRPSTQYPFESLILDNFAYDDCPNDPFAEFEPISKPETPMSSEDIFF